jgi:NADH-quinone oxidoreductase subunit M
MFNLLGIDALTILIFAPALAALVVAALPQNKALARWLSLGFATLIGALAVAVFFTYQVNAPNLVVDGVAAPYGFMDTVNNPNWFPTLHASWHLGIDGVSAAMVLLTGLLTPLAILISWEVEDRVNMHLALLLFFETGLMGVFLGRDLMVFFLFYELSLVPMYFIINQWGGPNRQYASTKFMIYSIGGTLGMLLATQLIGASVSTFDIDLIAKTWPQFAADQPAFMGISTSTVKALAFLGFFVAFGIKVPIWPFHTWLPDAHGEAPTAGSMLLAGVMLKLGAYGFVRLVVPFFPDVWASNIPLLGINVATGFAFLAMLGIVLGAFAAYGQNDIKRLVAYSSVNHMGFVGLGIAVMASVYASIWAAGQTGIVPDDLRQSAIIATNGTVIQMFNHGLSSAAMFLLAGGIYHKTHTRDIREYGGFWVKAPIFGAIFIFASMSSLGLPGLNGFIGEFLVVRGAFPVFGLITVLSMIGLLFTGNYILKGIRAVLHGPFNMHWKDYHLEIERRELIAIAPLLVLILVTGLAPNWILTVINGSVTVMMQQIGK